jgi:ABC-2 type transport system permease protein
MKERIRILITEIKFIFIRMITSYRFDWIAGNINLLLALIFLYIGINSFRQDVISSNVIDSKTIKMIVGMYIFVIIQEGLMGMVSRVTEGKAYGTFEQMVVNPYGSWFILFAKSVGASIISFISITIFAPLAMVITGKYFSVNLFKLILLLIPLLFSVFGIGFILAGLTLIYKRLQSFAYLIQFFVLSLMVLPSYPFSVYSLLPIAPQSLVINKVIASNVVISYKWWIYLYLNAFVYFFSGIKIYNYLEEIAREKGVLGHY